MKLTLQAPPDADDAAAGVVPAVSEDDQLGSPNCLVWLQRKQREEGQNMTDSLANTDTRELLYLVYI